MRRGDPWMSQLNDGGGLAPVIQEGKGKTTESGGRSTVDTDEPSMASPRLIPVPGSPPRSAQAPPEPMMDDTGHTSEPFGRNCVPSRIPVGDSTNYDQLSYDQSYVLCKQTGYRKDSKAALKTHLAAIDDAEKRAMGETECATDTSASVSGKRNRYMEKPLVNESAEIGQTWGASARGRICNRLGSGYASGTGA